MNPSLVGDVEVQVVASAEPHRTVIDVRILRKTADRKWHLQEASFESGAPLEEAVASNWTVVSAKVLEALKVDVPRQVA